MTFKEITDVLNDLPSEDLINILLYGTFILRENIINEYIAKEYVVLNEQTAYEKKLDSISDIQSKINRYFR